MVHKGRSRVNTSCVRIIMCCKRMSTMPNYSVDNIQHNWRRRRDRWRLRVPILLCKLGPTRGPSGGKRIGGFDALEAGAYYEDVFTTLPLGFSNSLAELRYGENFNPFVPPDNMFTNIDGVDCSAPPS